MVGTSPPPERPSFARKWRALTSYQPPGAGEPRWIRRSPPSRGQASLWHDGGDRLTRVQLSPSREERVDGAGMKTDSERPANPPVSDQASNRYAERIDAVQVYDFSEVAHRTAARDIIHVMGKLGRQWQNRSIARQGRVIFARSMRGARIALRCPDSRARGRFSAWPIGKPCAVNDPGSVAWPQGTRCWRWSLCDLQALDRFLRRWRAASKNNPPRASDASVIGRRPLRSR